MSFKVTVLPGEQTFTVREEQSVLDAALEAGIVLPYSCRNGTCSTCKGKVVSGSYDAGPAPAHTLRPEELEQGYTLLCQARPSSGLVVDAQIVRMARDIEVRKMPSRALAVYAFAPSRRTCCV